MLVSVAQLQKLKDVDFLMLLWEMDGNQSSWSIEAKITQSQQHELNQILNPFKELFCESTSLPPSRVTYHEISLIGGTTAVNVRLYHYGHFQKDGIEKLVTEMLAAGIIRPSCSPFSSPVLLVRKKDGSWRFCVDYRALNKVIVPYKYPILVISELLDELMVPDISPNWI